MVQQGRFIFVSVGVMIAGPGLTPIADWAVAMSTLITKGVDN